MQGCVLGEITSRLALPAINRLQVQIEMMYRIDEWTPLRVHITTTKLQQCPIGIYIFQTKPSYEENSGSAIFGSNSSVQKRLLR